MGAALSRPVGTPALTAAGLTKAFGGIPVLRGVAFELWPGTITAIAGENGAGKSTLMKIISGLYPADGGTVSRRGTDLPAGNVQAAIARGISIVPQELASIRELTVYENLYLGRERRTRLGTLDRAAMIADASAALLEFGLGVSPTERMGSLPVGVRQIIEIIKATTQGAAVILLDEPTSAISGREVEQLLRVMRNLRDAGVSLLFTTHKMEEIRAVDDRVVVLRDGRLIVDEPAHALTDDDIVTAMIGRELDTLFPDLPPISPVTVLEVEGLAVDGLASAGSEPTFDFEVRRGEILGLAGLVGAGRTELLEALFGVRRRSGTVRVKGVAVAAGSPRAAIAAGMALVPEDRKEAGAVLALSILDNASLPRISGFTRGGVIAARRRRTAIRTAMSSVALRSGLGQEVGTLSGGNQQKVVLGRWLTGAVDVLLLDEPTRGVDIGARSEIYGLIVELAARGMAVVMASSDLPEILSLSHRALVLADGAVAAELDKDDLSRPDAQDRIFRLASGQLSTTAPGSTHP